MSRIIQIGNEFINLYDDENPILNIGDECYFLFFNNQDYHIPLLAHGNVIDSLFNDGINVEYYINIKQLLDKQHIKQTYIFNNDKSFFVHNYYNNVISFNSKKTLKIRNDLKDLNNNVFKITAFFVRPTLNSITVLRQEYLKFCKNDLENQLKTVNNLLVL